MSFAQHVDLLSRFLERRAAIAGEIERRLLNVRGKELSRVRHRQTFDEIFTACFFSAAAIPPELARLKGQLAAAHAADGFEPVLMGGYARELDPLELIARAYDFWDRERWPGGPVRLAYAHNLFTASVIHQLEHLSLRIWDDDEARAGERLRDVQQLLDRLNEPGGTALIRDARWVIQTAQGPLTRHLKPYFDTADLVARTLASTDREVVHIAGVKLAGGHLRSQLRYRSWETELPIDHPTVMATTRNSNSMDVALLVRDLVPLLEAYLDANEARRRLGLADAILQGLSADPELLVTRLDLLKPFTMLEELFVERGGDGAPRYSAMGTSHIAFLDHYLVLLARAAAPLLQDAPALRPSHRPYSPFGIAYGFCADLLANFAMAPLRSLPPAALTLEDFFASTGPLEATAARAAEWIRLPTREGEREHFMHAPEWAQHMFERTVTALDTRASAGNVLNASGVRSARLFVVPESAGAGPAGFAPADAVNAQEHCVRSDVNRALADGSTAFPRHHLVADRAEGRFLASAETNGQWFGVSKVVLTACTSRGQDAVLTGVPAAVADVLPLTCAGLLVTT